MGWGYIMILGVDWENGNCYLVFTVMKLGQWKIEWKPLFRVYGYEGLEMQGCR